MAAPTTTTTTEPNYVINSTGSNVDAGNNDYVLAYNQCNLSKGLSIQTGTLTAMDVTILASNKDGTLIDITGDLFTGVTALAQNSFYMVDIPAPVKQIVVRAARSNATNAINLTIFAAKR